MSKCKTITDGVPQAPQMVEALPGLSVGGAPASEISSGLSEDERLGAVVGEYRGGNFIVHLNLYERGHSLKKRALPKGRWRRWMIATDAWPLWDTCWSYQANYGGSFMASGASTKAAAIAQAKCDIDEMVARAQK